MSGDDVQRGSDGGDWCRSSCDAPCLVERRLRESLQAENLRLATTLHDELGNRLFGTALCIAALRGRVAAVDPSLAATLQSIGEQLTEAASHGREAACAASDFLARHHGLEVALRMRFASAIARGALHCELALQPGAADDLSTAERVALLRLAEEVVAQVAREGARQVRVALRRSRLGTVCLSIAGEGRPQVDAAVAESYRALAVARRMAAQVEARVAVRRLADGSLLVRCGTRWRDVEWPGG
ncbi:MAG: histidine kinase [Steroidobacteraceae bacterium]|nr:histidine kinase [Steroidobacteraceae bacterium]